MLTQKKKTAEDKTLQTERHQAPSTNSFVDTTLIRTTQKQTNSLFNAPTGCVFRIQTGGIYSRE
jgi:hypothetical protein